MNVSVASLINRALSISDMVNSSQITALDANMAINEAYRTVYEFLTENNDDYFVTTLSATTTLNTYTLPSDFYKMRAVDYYNTASEWQEVKKFTLSQRNRFGNITSNVIAPMYRIKGTVLYLIPEGTTSQSIRLWYYPTPAQLASVLSVWATSTAYYVDDLAMQSGNCYQCIIAHTSGTFSTDLAASKWSLLYTAPSTSITYPNNLVEEIITHTAAIKFCQKTNRYEKAATIAMALGDPAEKNSGYWKQFVSAAVRDDANYERIRNVHGERRLWL